MKARMFCILVVFSLVTVSFAQKPHEVAASVEVNPTSVKVGDPVEIHLSIMNTGSKSLTIREVELYCGTSDQQTIWEEIVTSKRVTIKAGETWHVTVTYTPSCAGPWSLQAWMCFGGASGKSDLMTRPIPFTVTE